jgi:hypothetical protein
MSQNIVESHGVYDREEKGTQNGAQGVFGMMISLEETEDLNEPWKFHDIACIWIIPGIYVA